MLTHIRYLLVTALRDLLFAGLFLGVLAATALSAVLGGTAMAEREAMTLAFAAGSGRVILIGGLIIFVCFHLREAFDRKEIDVLLSRPLSRIQALVAYWLGFAFIAFLLTLALAALFSFLPLLSVPGYALWCVSLLLESWLAVSLALFAALTLRSAVASVLTAFGLYALGRLMGFFLATTDSLTLFHEVWLNQLLKGTLKAVALFIPRLDFFTQSEWLVYGIGQGGQAAMALFTQAVIYIPLLLAASCIDFLRRQF